MNKRLTLAGLILVATAFITPSQAAAALPTKVGDQGVPSLAPMVEEVSPAVVDISVAGTHVQRQQIPELFQRFFGAPQEQVREQPFRGLGSGVIVDAKQGYIVTNSHVVNGADKIRVGLNDGRDFDAKLIGQDEQADIALLQIEADNLTEIKKADSDKLRVGDFVVAIGNPFGLGQTVTSGIISALGRSNLNIGNYENFIQTDAAINSGNSGGALINLKGELVGINTAIIAPGGGNVGIGFAIPANMVHSFTHQLIEFGEIRRGVLGVAGRELTPDLAETFGHHSKYGAFVNEVFPGSAAAEAGIKSGDIIISLDGKPVKSFGELRAKIGTMGAGSTVKLGIVRNGDEKSIEVTLKRADDQQVLARVIHPRLEGATLSDDSEEPSGILVEELVPRSPAAVLGLRKGDKIIGMNNNRIQNLKQLRQKLGEEPPVIALNILRDNRELYLVIN